jgi:hypothetical protein
VIVEPFDLQDRRRAAAFPDEVYRESVRLREYRYIERDDRIYISSPANAGSSRKSTTDL